MNWERYAEIESAVRKGYRHCVAVAAEDERTGVAVVLKTRLMAQMTSDRRDIRHLVVGAVCMSLAAP